MVNAHQAKSTSTDGAPPHYGSTGHNDPLANLTPKQIFTECIWLSSEPPLTKLFLMCVSRFMNKELRSSSMSYSQIATDCSVSERFAKRAATAARDRWLKIEVGKGRQTKNGRQNLYHGIIPSDLVAELRARRSKGISVRANGVNVMHLDGVHTVHGVHGTTDRGAPGAHLLSNTPKGRGGGAPTGVNGVHPNKSNGQAAMASAVGGEAAYAECNITVSDSGMLSIGEEFRKELQQAFTDSQIDGALNCTLAAMGRDRNKILIAHQLRRQCTFKRDNDNKTTTFAQRAPGIIRNGRPSL